MTIARVSGQNGGNAAANATSVSKAYAGNVTSGHLLIIQAAKYTPSSDPFVAGDCTKSAGTATIGTVTLDRQRSYTDGNGNIYSVATWSVIVTGTGSCTMQVGGAVAGSYLIMSIQELSGSWNSSRVENGNDGAANTGAPDSGNAASAGAAIFVASLATDVGSSTTHTIDSAYTLNYEMENGAAHQTGAFGDRIVSTGTTDSGSWTAPTTIPYVCMVVVYKEASSAVTLNQVSETDTALPITAKGGSLFKATHESNDLSEYSGSVVGSNNIQVLSGSALHGSSYGMQVSVTDANPHYSYATWSPSALNISVFEYRVYIKRGTLSLSDLGQVSHVFFINASGTGVFGSAKIMNVSGSYYLRCVLVDDSGTHQETTTFALDTNEHVLEMRITKASTNSSNDAKLEWWVDGSAQTTISGYDLYDNMTLLTIAVGAVGQSGTVSGTFHLDEIETNITGAYIGTTVRRTVNQVSETDTAQAFTHRKIKTIGQVSETDLAQAITRVKRKALGQPSETDLAQAISRQKIKSVLQVSETDLAQVITRVSNTQTISVLQASETDQAQSVAVRKVKNVLQVSETDLAQAITHRKIKTVGQVTETDAAQVFSVAKRLTVGQVSETDLAQAITHRKIKALGQVTETDAAQVFSVAKRLTIGQVSETDLAQTITHRKIKTFGQVTETDSAQSISVVAGVIVGQVEETDLAQAIAHRKIKTVGQVSETDSAQIITRVTGMLVQQVEENDLAQALFPQKRVAVAQAFEIDLAQPLSARKVIALGQVTETDLAQALTAPGAIVVTIGQVVEVDSALAIVLLGLRVISIFSTVREQVSANASVYESVNVNSSIYDVISVESEDAP